MQETLFWTLQVQIRGFISRYTVARLHFKVNTEELT